MEYKINISEILSRDICITADSPEKALAEAKRRYDAGEIILEWDDLASVEISEA